MDVGFLLGIFYLFFDILYWAKWTACCLVLFLKRKIKGRRFDLYDFDLENVPEKMGMLVPVEERVLESPLSEEELENNADEVFIYGVNSKSETLVVRISRASNDISEAWVFLKLADGRWFELEKTLGFQRNFGDKCTSFTSGGLQMYYLSAMRRWRIIYCGMLKEGKRANETGTRPIFVKFTFIWTASSDVFDATSDVDMKSVAKSMSRAKWNSPFPPVDKLAEFLDFYCQSGVLNGIVSIEDEPDREIYFFGEKMRFRGKRSYVDGSKIKHIVGAVPESGLILHLARVTIPNIVHNMYMGYIVHPNGYNYNIKDGNMITNLSGNDVEGKNMTAMIKTGRHDYELKGDFVRDGVRCFSSKIWAESKIAFIESEFEIDDCKGRGFLISAEIFGQPKMEKTKISNVPRFLASARPRAVYFTDEESHSTDLTGGKGSSLGKLTKLSNEMRASEFVVPRGIIVTTVAYNEFLTSEIIEKIENLKNVAYGNIKGNVHEACKIVASAVERTPLPDKVSKEIEEKLNKLFNGNIHQYKVAVRSSSIGEDTDQMSAAGQMETFLGVRGIKEIFTAVKKCWASQFGYIAIEYKRQNGQVLNSSMAVVIQEMVNCESAGVLFTCHPVTNNPSVTVITANYGLGESVVSGTEEPDTVLLEKLPNMEMNIKSVIVGMKQHRIVMTGGKISEDERTVTEDVPEEEQNKCCISENMALKLGKLASKIEDYFKSPRDIEWGIRNGTIYILQSRPITTGSAASDYEIKHELDCPLRCEKDYFTRANVGEVLPGAMSPLSTDISPKYFSITMQGKEAKCRQRNSFMQVKYFQSGMAIFCQHAMMDVASLLTREEDIEGTTFEGMMIGVFGRKLEDPDLYNLIKRKKYNSLKKSLRYYFTTYKNMFFSGYGIEQIRRQAFNYQHPSLKGRTAKEIFRLLMHACSDHTKSFQKHMTCSEMSGFWNAKLFSILQRDGVDENNEVYSDFSKLLGTMSNVESADVPSAMQDLTRLIVKEIKGEDFRAMTVEAAQKWLESSTTQAGNKYRQFLKRHGHRCIKESDMYAVTWATDPKPLIKLLQSISSSLKEAREVEEIKDISKILPQLSAPLTLKSRLLLRLVLPNCRRGVREREACKSNFIKTMDNTRKGYQHLSKAMVAEGYLPDMDLLYFLTIDEIDQLLESRNPRLIARANHRRKLYPELNALLFPEISKGLPVPMNERQDEEIEYVADLTMKGIPVSKGSVKGYARVALSVEEATNLKPGEILIAIATDIGWSPYFPILAGVVTELGGLISHGAVVSREYGLPCVVGLHGATKQFRTGDYVLLDGNKGILQRLSPPET